MSAERETLLRFEGFFIGVAGTASFAILASTMSGREPEPFLFSVMPWVAVIGGLGGLLIARLQRRTAREADNG